MFNFKASSKTFKPTRKNVPEGATHYHLKKYAEATLGSGNLRLAVQLPEGEDLNEWLAVNAVDFFNQINMLYGTITEFCTPQECPVMSAGPKYEYLWCDGITYKKPVKVSAPEYVDNLMNWVQSQLDDESIFPSKIGVPFPKAFQSTVKTIFKRLFRVYAHIYHAHFPRIVSLGQEAHLNTSFKHFMFFVQEFNLVEKKELVPLDELIRTLTAASAGTSGGTPASGTVSTTMRRPFDDDDDDDDFTSRVAPKRRALYSDTSTAATTSSAPNGPKPPPPAAANDDSEEDPLDAFMAGITSQVQQESTSSASTAKPATWRDDLEEEDNVESYINHMKSKGIEVGKSKAPQQTFVDSDEEVYAAAKAADTTKYEVDDDGSYRKKEIEPLAPVDHSLIQYIEIEKNLYEEHPDIAALDAAEVARIRRELDIRVSGFNVPNPCISFAHFNFDPALLSLISRQGFSSPTGIQRQAIPAALSGRDLIGIAATGSGKTAAFVWPMLTHIMDQPELEKGDGPIGLVLAPTRELAQQIHLEAKKYGKAYGLRAAVVFGGASKGQQFQELRSTGGVEILVATPGRLIDLIKMKATNLRRVSFLVLDEADKMFEFGFEPQIRSICNNVRPDRQTLLFSATFQKRVERLARDVLEEPIRITIGGVGHANADVTQVVAVLPDDTHKWGWLTSRIPGFLRTGSLLIFITRKAGVDELATNLNAHGYPCLALHGDMHQVDRDRVISQFKSQKCNILVSTDVAGRGLDIKHIRNVVNYDVARDIDSHVHRCGRTGRAGEKGTASTLVTQKEDKFAAELVRNLEDSGQTVPRELMEVAMKNP
ncbi:hypothetical protein HDU96_007482, partial [Phlyctochytrium bullatum]